MICVYITELGHVILGKIKYPIIVIFNIFKFHCTSEHPEQFCGSKEEELFAERKTKIGDVRFINFSFTLKKLGSQATSHIHICIYIYIYIYMYIRIICTML